jgi:hypothetical protein
VLAVVQLTQFPETKRYPSLQPVQVNTVPEIEQPEQPVTDPVYPVVAVLQLTHAEWGEAPTPILPEAQVVQLVAVANV